jgi:hypothetical protein
MTDSKSPLLAALLHQLKMHHAPPFDAQTESALQWKAKEVTLEVGWKDGYTLRLWRDLPNGGRVGESLLDHGASFGPKVMVRKLIEFIERFRRPENKSQS